MSRYYPLPSQDPQLAAHCSLLVPIEILPKTLTADHSLVSLVKIS